mmetsp:Transcript_63636/g.110908  ORF Transcript_63636/g.110908 Transcript_63636/m.110908 type:complete len:161 (+) Transcript_63636:58-540(+)
MITNLVGARFEMKVLEREARFLQGLEREFEGVLQLLQAEEKSLLSHIATTTLPLEQSNSIAEGSLCAPTTPPLQAFLPFDPLREGEQIGAADRSPSSSETESWMRRRRSDAQTIGALGRSPSSSETEPFVKRRKRSDAQSTAGASGRSPSSSETESVLKL